MKRACSAAVEVVLVGALVLCVGVREVADLGVKPADQGPLSVHLIVGKDPFELNSTFCELRNNGDKPVAISWRTPAMVAAYIDVEVLDPSGRRISQEFYEGRIASLFLSENEDIIEPGKSLELPVRIFFGVAEADRKPGKYRCRVRFVYKEFKATSEFVEVELTEAHLRGSRP